MPNKLVWTSSPLVFPNREGGARSVTGEDSTGITAEWLENIQRETASSVIKIGKAAFSVVLRKEPDRKRHHIDIPGVLGSFTQLSTDLLLRDAVFKTLCAFLKRIPCDVICAIPIGGVPWATLVSMASGKPMGVVRFEGVEEAKKKRDFLRVPKNISGKHVVLVDDTIVKGRALRRSVQLLRNAGAIIDFELVAFEAEGGQDGVAVAQKDMGVKVLPAFSFRTIIKGLDLPPGTMVSFRSVI